jgi:hypothetical protein
MNNNKYFNVKNSSSQILPPEAESFISADFSGIADELQPLWRESENYYKSDSSFYLKGDRNSISSGKRWVETLLVLPVNTGTIIVKIFSVETGQLLIKKSIPIIDNKYNVFISIDMKSIDIPLTRARFEVDGKVCEQTFERVSDSAFNSTIPINIDNLTQGEDEVLYFGVPFPEGSLWNVSNLILTDSLDNEIAADFEKKANWGYEGSVKWVGVNSIIPAGLTQVYVKPGTSSSIINEVGVTQSGSEITVNTGVATYVIDDSISIIKINSPEIVNGLYIIDQNDRIAQHEELTKVIEKQNSVTACIKIEGVYKYLTEELARHITRLEFFYGQPQVKVTHTLILTRNTNQIWFKEMGWELPIPNSVGSNKIINISTDNLDNSSFATFSIGSGINIYQKYGKRMGMRPQLEGNRWVPRVVGDDEFVISDSSTSLYTGVNMGDWVSITGDGGNFMFACKDLALQSPKAFVIDDDKINFKLFTSGTGATGTDFYEGQMSFSMSAIGERWGMKPYIVMTASDINHFNATISGESNSARIDRAVSRSTDAIGWSKTHEFIISLDDNLRWVSNLKNPPFAHTDTEWIYQTKVIGNIHHKDVLNYPLLEEIVDRAFLAQSLSLPIQLSIPGRPSYSFKGNDSVFRGFFDYCAGPVYVYPERWRLTYSYTYDAWYLFIRSGERVLREIATKINRAFMDNYIAHWDSENPSPLSKTKGLFVANLNSYTNNTGPGNFPLYWSDSRTFQLTTTTDIERSILDYYLTGYGRAKDIVEQFESAMLQEWTFDRIDFRTLQVVKLIDQSYKFSWSKETKILLEKTFWGNPRILDEEGELYITKNRPYNSTTYKLPTDVDVFTKLGYTLDSPYIHKIAQKAGRFIIEASSITGRSSGITPHFIYNKESDNTFVSIFEHMATDLARYLRSDGTSNVGWSDFPKFLRGLPLYMDILTENNNFPVPVSSWLHFIKIEDSDTRILVYKTSSERLNLILQCPHSGSTQSLTDATVSYGFVGSAINVVPQNPTVEPTWAGQNLHQITEYSSGQDDERCLVKLIIPKDAPAGIYEIILNRDGDYRIFSDKNTPMMFYASNGFKSPPLRSTTQFYGATSGVADTRKIYFQVPSDSLPCEISVANPDSQKSLYYRSDTVFDPDVLVTPLPVPTPATTLPATQSLTASGIWSVQVRLPINSGTNFTEAGIIRTNFPTYFSFDKSFYSQIFVETPPETTQLRSDFRGITLNSLGQNIYVDSKSGVVTYRYRIEEIQTSTITFYDRNLNYFNLITAGVSPEYNKEYSIRVAFDKGSGFGIYGASYSVFTPDDTEL